MNKRLGGIILLIVALFLSVGIGYALVSYQGEGVAYDRNPPKPSAQPVRTEIPPKSDEPAKTLTGPLTGADLSLGALHIGDTMELVKKTLGEPNQIKQKEDGLLLHQYANMEVYFLNGVVCALISDSSSVGTPRNIHDGASAQEVFTAYGTDYTVSDYNGLKLYEYTIVSHEGKNCILRFAIRNSDSKVDYISIRTN